MQEKATINSVWSPNEINLMKITLISTQKRSRNEMCETEVRTGKRHNPHMQKSAGNI